MTLFFVPRSYLVPFSLKTPKKKRKTLSVGRETPITFRKSEFNRIRDCGIKEMYEVEKQASAKQNSKTKNK